jgi:hypothetical protein
VADAVVVGNAFHHFYESRALTEICRSFTYDAPTELLARIDDLTRDLPEILALPGGSVVDLCRREL